MLPGYPIAQAESAKGAAEMAELVCKVGGGRRS